MKTFRVTFAPKGRGATQIYTVDATDTGHAISLAKRLMVLDGMSPGAYQHPACREVAEQREAA